MKKLLYILVPILFVVITGLSFYFINHDNKEVSKDDYLEDIPGVIDDVTDYISLDEFNKISIGMTYDEVRNIIGMSGIIFSNINENGQVETTFRWYGKDRNSYAEFHFKDDILINKYQFDLK